MGGVVEYHLGQVVIVYGGVATGRGVSDVLLTNDVATTWGVRGYAETYKCKYKMDYAPYCFLCDTIVYSIIALQYMNQKGWYHDLANSFMGPVLITYSQRNCKIMCRRGCIWEQ